MVGKSWTKGVKVALLAGVMGLAGFAEAKDVYYVSGYFGTPTDGAKMVVKDEQGNIVNMPISDSDVLVIREGTANGPIYGTAADSAYVSSETNYVPKHIRIERDFTFNAGVGTALFGGSTIEVASDKKLVIQSTKWNNAFVGTVVFDGDGTIDLSGASSVSDPLKISAGMKFKLPENSPISIVITDPENLDPDDYPGYVVSVDEKGTTHLVKKDQVVAFVGETAYPTLADAFTAAKPAGAIRLAVKPNSISTIPNGIKNAAEWQGTIEMGWAGNTASDFSFGYDLQNWANTSSKICLNGYKNYPCAPTNESRVGRDIVAGVWVIGEKGVELWGDFSNFGFNYVGNLEGNGLLKISNTGDSNWAQNYVRFKGDPSKFEGSINMTGSGYRLILAPSDAGAAEQWSSITAEYPMIHVSGVTAKVAEGKTWTAKTIKIEGTIGGAGTLNGAAIFKDTAAIDLADGALTANSATFGSTLTLKNAAIGDAVLKCASAPTNLNTLKLKDETGAERNDWLLVYETKKKLVRLYPAQREPMTLYWQDKADTFWEHLGDNDVHGNNGMMRDANGEEVIHQSEDTVIFDKAHYTSANWDYSENLYIKASVIPGSKNEWDLKILEGVNLKLGFCGATATGQNITQNFKIYVEGATEGHEASTLELGYWGNTHHKDGLLRDNVTFGGDGKVTLGSDLGNTLVVNNVKGTATIDLQGKELKLTGGTVANPITGMGTLSGSGTISSDIEIPTGATLDLTGSLVFTGNVTFNDSVTINLTAAPTEKTLLMTAAEGKNFVLKNANIDVLVKVNGALEPAFYTFEVDGDKLYVKPAEVKIKYTAEVVLGYDYKTMLCRVTMNPAIDGVVATVVVNGVDAALSTWTAPIIGMRNQGRAEVMVGDADDNFVPSTYTMTVSIGSWKEELEFTLASENEGKLAQVGDAKFDTMKEAVTAAGETGTIKLLTNVFFAPPPGIYTIERGEYDIFIVNDMAMTANENAVTISAPDTVDHYSVMKNKNGEDAPFVIAGSWLGAALPWKTQKEIQTALLAASTNGLSPYEAYALGLGAAEMGTAQLIARGIQTDDPDTIEISDGYTPISAAETGIVVSKKLVDSETKDVVSDSTIYNLKTMVNKSALVKLDYSFTPDEGQIGEVSE